MRTGFYIALFLLASCNGGEDKSVIAEDFTDVSDEQLTPTELVQWNDEGFQNKQQQVGDLTYSITHVAPEYLAIHELGINAEQSQIDSVKQYYSEMEYFKLKIEAPEFADELLRYQLESTSQYDERVRYCSFGIVNDVTMSIDEAPAIQCGLNQFERTFNVGPVLTIMLGFPKQELTNSKNVVVTFDDHLFNKGMIRFSWSAEEFSSFPKLADK